MLVFSLAVGIVICYLIPVAGLVLLWRKVKGAGKAFLIGALAFTVSQPLIRIPILQLVLPGFGWYAVLQLLPWEYGLFLGFTAGLFEESARWAAMSFLLKRQRDMEHGLAFGLGHGGVEAMLLIGPNMIAGLMMVLAGQGALFPADAGSVLTAGAERIFAMMFHVGASLLLMYGVKAVALHTVLDAAVVILPSVFGVGVLGIEVYAAALGGMTLLFGIYVWRGKRCLVL